LKSRQLEFSPKRFAIAFFIGIGVLAASIFGVGILNNIHSRYLRTLSHWTVLIHNSKGGGATGFIARGKSGHKYIITNGHVCGLAEDGKLFVIYKDDEYVLKVRKVYQLNDLCAIDAPESAGLAVNIATSYKHGEEAFAIGHPLLEPTTVTLGELSGEVTTHIMVGQNLDPKDCSGPTYELIDLSDNPFAVFFGVSNICVRNLPAEASSIIILPGNSGSAVVNNFGSVIGVAFAANESGTRSYVVPLEYLKDFLSSL
jgi:S1-C subfamily serine protease